ncbi:MAG TPA: tannase/feruloyl esterase family alpha/beta hydrolase [Vicinamibacterales bacterium]|jgi:feruloyl esterase
MTGSKVLAAAAAVAVSAAAAAAQNGSQFRDWNDTALADNPRLAPKLACAALVSQTGYDVSVLSATTIAAAGDVPDFCRVIGLIQPEVRFEVDLPARWNGRVYMLGNGGYAGEALDNPGREGTAARAVGRGFVAVQTNTGHDGATEPLAAFAANPQKLADYAFRAVHVTVVTAKALASAYYTAPASRAYFDGCSTGGRQGLISAQRFPDDFDGIVVGAPVLNFSATMIGYAKDQKALAAAPLNADAVRTIAEAVLAKCDVLDGVKDGAIDDPRRCPFNPSKDIPTCGGDAPAAGCLTAAQIGSVETIYAPLRRGSGAFFPGWPVGAESGWIPWFQSPNGKSIAWSFGEAYLKNIAFGRARASYDWLTFDVNADLDKIQASQALIDATSPDLSRFKARGGKIVSYVGWADPALNPLMSVGYYESVTQAMGPSTPEFYRMFMVPGMAHCGGGSGTSAFDAFTPLVQWVEKGTAPASLPASRVVDGKVVRTRPLCPYPQTAIYKGSGSTDDAANFACGVR